MQVRVLSYNVQSFHGGMDLVAGVVTEQKPDIVLLQECGRRLALNRFAGSLGMEAVSTHRPFNPVQNAVLFRAPWRLGWHEVRHFAREGKAQRRGMVGAQLRQTGTPLTIVSTHLGLVPRERPYHAEELTDFLAGIEGPVVVGVDLNESDDQPAARWLSDRLFDAFTHADQAGPDWGATFPADAPSARIDYVFVSEGIAIKRAWVPSSELAAEASDHRPVVSDLEFGE